MAGKLSRDGVLRGILQTLVSGWGYNAVLASLQNLDTPIDRKRSSPRAHGKAIHEASAVRYVEDMDVSANQKGLLFALAESYDEGSAFPKLTDVRTFLMSHQQDAKDLKSRPQAFKRMLPILLKMSDKGLEKVLSRSRHSGPAELEPISNAIRGAGEELRGTNRAMMTSVSDDKRTDTDNISPTSDT